AWVARMAEPQERLEHLLAQMRRNARAVVVHGYREPAVVAMSRNRDRRRMPRGVRHEVAKAALERSGPHGNDRMAAEVHTRLVTVALGVGLEFFEEGPHVGWRRRLARTPAREREISFQHAAHLVHILLHRLDFGALADKGKLELETREDGAQVVRNSRQHRGALFQRALDATLHLDERNRSASNLARAARAQGEARAFRAPCRAFDPRPPTAESV